MSRSRDICKRYLKAHLLDEDWPYRVALIERFTCKLPYPTRFCDEGGHLLRRMKAVRGPAGKMDPADPVQLKQLAVLVERMHGAGIVHGDLHLKNLFWDGHNVVIADFEPSLLQLKGYRPSLMATSPFIHPHDASTRRLSRLTDLMCLIHLSSGLNASACARRTSRSEEPEARMNTGLRGRLPIEPELPA